MPDLEVLTWETFGTASRALAEQIVADGFEPDIVLGIARGGLIPAGALAYALSVKNLFTMNVEFYTGQGTTLDEPLMLPPFLDPKDIEGMRVLVVDDVADTGRTLRLVADFCRDLVSEVRIAVIYEKPGTVVHGDYVWKTTEQWIDFPWSTEDAIIR